MARVCPYLYHKARGRSPHHFRNDLVSGTSSKISSKRTDKRASDHPLTPCPKTYSMATAVTRTSLSSTKRARSAFRFTRTRMCNKLTSISNDRCFKITSSAISTSNTLTLTSKISTRILLAKVVFLNGRKLKVLSLTNSIGNQASASLRFKGKSQSCRSKRTSPFGNPRSQKAKNLSENFLSARSYKRSPMRLLNERRNAWKKKWKKVKCSKLFLSFIKSHTMTVIFNPLVKKLLNNGMRVTSSRLIGLWAL